MWLLLLLLLGTGVDEVDSDGGGVVARWQGDGGAELGDGGVEAGFGGAPGVVL